MLDTADIKRKGVAVPSRLLRLQPYEALIFIVMIVLFALCLAAAPVVTSGPPKNIAQPSAGPISFALNNEQ